MYHTNRNSKNILLAALVVLVSFILNGCAGSYQGWYEVPENVRTTSPSNNTNRSTTQTQSDQQETATQTQQTTQQQTQRQYAKVTAYIVEKENNRWQSYIVDRIYDDQGNMIFSGVPQRQNGYASLSRSYKELTNSVTIISGVTFDVVVGYQFDGGKKRVGSVRLINENAVPTPNRSLN